MEQTERLEQLNKLKKKKFIPLYVTIAIVIIGVIDVALGTAYRSSTGTQYFSDRIRYNGLWEWLVDWTPFPSAYLAILVWLLLAIVVCVVLSLRHNKKVKHIVAEKDKEIKELELAGIVVEFRRKCNSCGNIYFYTPADLERNRKLLNSSILENVTGIATAATGHLAASAVSSSNADRHKNGMVDYDKCPKCNSIDTRLLSDVEWEREKAAIATPQTSPAAAVSTADELKKYKELLDSGIITQEDFDAKKKQLLGL